MADKNDSPASFTYRAAEYTETYSNNIAVECRLLEFRLRFGLSVYPEPGEAAGPFLIEFFQGILISPTQAKYLAACLTQEVRRYEECFGPIPMAAAPLPAPKTEEPAKPVADPSEVIN